MKIQASAQPQSSQVNGAPTGGRDQQTHGAFDDALAGAEGATAGGGTADATGGSPALTGTTPKLAALLSQVAAATSTGPAPTALAQSGPAQSAPVSTGQGQQAAPSVSLAWSAVTGATGPAAPAAVPATADAAAAQSSAALAGTADGDVVPVAPAGRRGAGTRDQGATASSASAATAPVNPTADLMTFLSAAILRNGTTAAGGGAGAAAGATASGQTPPVGGGSSGAAAAGDTTGAVDADQPQLALSGVAIEGHLAPVIGKAATPTGDAELAASARLMPAQPTDASAMTPLRAIASSISSLAAQGPASSRAIQGQAVPDDVTAAVPTAARTMTLQLSPANLGTVNVRLHVTGQTLDVELSLSNQQTLGLVSRERDVLASALRGQNYDLHSLVIQGADTSSGQSGLQYASDGGTGSGGAATNGDRSATGNGNGDGTGQGAQGGTDRQPGREDAGSGDSPARPAVDALFV